jgi:hypothetical protein
MILYENNLSEYLPFIVLSLILFVLGIFCKKKSFNIGAALLISWASILGIVSFKAYSEICCSPQATVTGKLQDKQQIQCGKSSNCWAIWVGSQRFSLPQTSDLERLKAGDCYRITFYPHVMDVNHMLGEKTPLVARIQQRPEYDGICS